MSSRSPQGAGIFRPTPPPSLLGDASHHVKAPSPKAGQAWSREGCRREHSKDPTKRSSSPHGLQGPGRPLHTLLWDLSL